MTRGVYRFSGGFSTTALLLALAAAALMLAGVAFAYETAVDHPAAALFAPLAVVLACTALGAAVTASVVRWQKMRSKAGIAVAVFCGGAIGVSVGWLLRAHAIDALATASPPAVGRALRHAAGQAIALGPVDIRGDALRWLWACELALALGAVVAIARRARRTPLCPYCRRWCKHERAVTRLPAVPLQQARAALARGDFVALARPGTAGARGPMRLDLARCDGCNQTNALSVYVERRLRADKIVVQHLLLGSDAVRTVRHLGRAT